MAEIILDAGSGNTCKNDIKYVERMIDELAAIDTGKHEIIIKWQLFEEAPPNIPLDWGVFFHAYQYGWQRGYKTTASVSNKDCLDFLLTYEVPFVKIANRPNLYWLAEEVPRKIPVYISYSDLSLIDWNFYRYNNFPLLCISEYPATIDQYIKTFDGGADGDFNMRYLMGYGCGISDHTTDFELWNKYQPKIYECHYKLADSTGLDAGDFARTPEQLKEVL